MNKERKKSRLNKRFQFSSVQDYENIKRSNSNGELFEDTEFVAGPAVLTNDVEAQTIVINYMGKTHVRRAEIEWLRPREICERQRLSPPVLYGEKRNRFDINQGDIGNCWFLAALANLAENDPAFQRVVPDEQGFEEDQYIGAFRFRFYRFGSWYEVVIDDKLPTRNGKLLYLKADEPNEFWTPLLEKAYAKFYGSYQALESGTAIEAAVDFTGGIPEYIDISEIGSEGIETREQEIFLNLERAYKRDAFLFCSMSNSSFKTAGLDLGLQDRHEYTITKIHQINDRETTIPLIRLWNPHGNSKEWTGHWSDSCDQWSNVPDWVKEEIGLVFENDGEFYMNFNQHFLKYFGEIEVVHINPKNIECSLRDSEKIFDVFHMFGKWEDEAAEGAVGSSLDTFLKNPKFVFTLSDPDPKDEHDLCPVIVSLAQKNNQRREEWAIGFRIYEIDSHDIIVSIRMKPEPVGLTNFYYNLREVSQRFELPVGKYCVIPSTFNSGEVGEFLIKVFVEKSLGSSDQSQRMSFRLSSKSLNSAERSPTPSPIPSPKISPLPSPPILRQRCQTVAGQKKLQVPTETQGITKLKRRLVKSLNFSQSVDQDWEVFQRVVEHMKSKHLEIPGFEEEN